MGGLRRGRGPCPIENRQGRPLQRHRYPGVGGPEARRGSHSVSRQSRAGWPAGETGHTLKSLPRRRSRFLLAFGWLAWGFVRSCPVILHSAFYLRLWVALPGLSPPFRIRLLRHVKYSGIISTSDRVLAARMPSG